MRASGKLATTASWIRRFILSHPEYNRDSLVSDSIVADLTVKVDELVHGKAKDESLIPPSASQPCYQ